MRKAKKPKKTLAERADRHRLYQRSVQDVVAECDFVESTFRKLKGRMARSLREDFCGTANTSCEWVRRNRNHRATAVDLDAAVLEWGARHNIGKLNGSAFKRIVLIEDNVASVKTEPVDIVLAMNFSYQLFDTRSDLRRYFRHVRNSLVDGGVFFLDAYGGYDSYREIKDKREYNGYTYIWDQARYDPISGRMQTYIHFYFPDGSKMKRAFSYSWRLWTLPEIRDLLDEVGFTRVTVWWEGTDEETGEGNGIFEPTLQGSADAGWICYLSAEK